MRSTEQNVKDELFTEQALRSFQSSQRRSAKQQQQQVDPLGRREALLPPAVQQQQQHQVVEEQQPPALLTFPAFQYIPEQQQQKVVVWDGCESSFSMSLSRSQQSTQAGSTTAHNQLPPAQQQHVIFSSQVMLQQDNPLDLSGDQHSVSWAKSMSIPQATQQPSIAGGSPSSVQQQQFQFVSTTNAATSSQLPMMYCVASPQPQFQFAGPISQPAQQMLMPQQTMYMAPQGYPGVFSLIHPQQQQQPVYFVPQQPQQQQQQQVQSSSFTSQPQNSNFVVCFPQC